MTQIIFLPRAYNDLDMQFSVIAALAEQSEHSIAVIGTIADDEVFDPRQHELTDHPAYRDKIRFTKITDLPESPLVLRLTANILAGCRRIRRKHPLWFELLKPADLVFRVLQRRLLQGNLGWLTALKQKWQQAAFITDEAIFQPGRSPVLDHIVAPLAEAGNMVAAIKTGHHIYKVSNPSGSSLEHVTYRQTPVRFFSVSGPLDYGIETKKLPDIPVQHWGNARMSLPWITSFAQKLGANQHMPTPSLSANSGRRITVAIMLSKVNYGVNLEELKACLRALAQMPDVDLLIKPHTRGMKFDFMDKQDLPGAKIVPHLPSTTLIAESDLVLFTGSSIVFHSMLLGKAAGYLKFAQSLPTLFDDENYTKGRYNYCLENLDDLHRAIQDLQQNPPGNIAEDSDEFLRIQLYGAEAAMTDVPNRIAGQILSGIKD